ncbi:DNA repair protein RadA [Treponema denticola]|uniref:DNA repair protein RadA n=1 Tax=Treponema denticola TaxID=158 RepID=UPI0002B5D2E6|nr:DNA repair protein RadA [Treponema denticola]EMB26472.1 DNA repair protein RadA [Treponema denticola SP37]EPF33793.1 DNA repair protein RadA [Treponema denticola SP44]EPF39497.1 DNA repair protein RadA [Treponema denticola SP23]
MAKKKTGDLAHRCSKCGYTQARWLGRCPECGEWNTFEEVTINQDYSAAERSIAEKFVKEAHSVPLDAIEANDAVRLSTGIAEFDRVLGGGAVKRSAILIGGEPGIGKSTLLLQAASASSSGSVKKVLYVSGEESGGQIRSRADRLNLPLKNIELLCTCRLEDVERVLNKVNPVFVIIDSIQTMYSADAGAVPGTINQFKLCAHELVSWVKERDSVLFLTAHVTKDGNIAGPKVLEHLVDTVISFERTEDDVRFLRALKNRFGSVDELGIFSMDESGLKAIDDPSSLFITNRTGPLPAGSAAVPVCEGSRVFMVEIQALTVPAKGAVTRVFSDKIDSARVSRIAAVLEKRIGLQFSDQDIYVNVAGGIRLKEPAADLAIALALYSARANIPAQKEGAYIGELSLAGEIRSVKKLKQRIKTAQSMGFTKVVSPPPSDSEAGDINTSQLFKAEDLSSAIKKVFG